MRKTITSLLPGKQYSIQFRAVGDESVSEWSQELSFQTSSDIVAPAKIAGLTGVSVDKSFSIRWDEPTKNTDGSDLTDFKDYKVTVESNGVSRVFFTTSTFFDFVYDQNVTSFGVARPSVKFYVSARDTSLNSNVDQASVILTNAFPTPASTFEVMSITDALRFTWTPSTDNDVALYRVYKGNTATTTSEKIYEGSSPQFLYATKDYTTRFFRVSTVDNFRQETFTTGSITAAPSRAGADTTPPVDPAWAANWYSIETDLSNPYVLRKDAVLTWTANTVDVDFDHYVLSYRKAGTTAFSQITSYSNSTRLTGLAPNTTYELSVASVDRARNRSNFVPAPTVLDTGQDTGAPAKPSTPTTENYIGQLLLVWNGKTSTGTDMPNDFSHVSVYASTTSGFTPGPTNYVARFNAANTTQRTIIGGLSFDNTYYIKMIAQDFSGNLSPVSDQVTGSAKKINGTDIQDASINSAKISELNAGKITTGELSAETKIIAGSSLDTHAELTGTGLRVFGKNSDVLDDLGNVVQTGSLREVLRLGTSSNDYFGVISPEGDLLAGIDAEGGGVFQNLNTTNLDIDGTTFSEFADKQAGGLVGRYHRSGQARPKIYQVERGIVEFYAPVKSGKEYTAQINCEIFPETAGKDFRLFIRESQDGRSPTTTSKAISSKVYSTHDTQNGKIVQINMLARIRASSDTNVRLLFSGVAEAGSIFMTSRNAFFDVRDEGYVSSVTMGGSSDGAYTDPNNGGFITPVPAPTPEEPNPEPILMTTTRRYQAVWSGTYNSNGQLRPYLDIYQGKDANTPNDGNRRSLIGFPTQIKTDLAGAQIHSMKLFLHSSSAAMASNSQVRIGAHGAINRPNNYISEGTVVRVERMGKWYWNRGQTRWIPLPKDSWDIFKFDDGYKGIFIGPWYSDSTNQFIGFHGAGKGSKSPVLEIIYTK